MGEGILQTEAMRMKRIKFGTTGSTADVGGLASAELALHAALAKARTSAPEPVAPVRAARPRGAVLLLSLIIMVTMAIMCVALAQLSMATTNVTQNNEDGTQALLMAEAGIGAAIQEISKSADLNSKDGTIGSATESWNADGSQKFQVVSTTAGLTAGDYKLKSLGTYNQVSRLVEAVVGRGKPVGTFFAGAFGVKSLDASGSSYTDSYDSAKGTTYEVQVAAAGGAAAYHGTLGGKDGDVGSNGNVSVGGSSHIYGDATAGPTNPPPPGYSVTASAGQVSGTIGNYSAPQVINPVTYAPNGPVMASIPSTMSPTGGYNSTGEYHFSSWSSSNVTISGSGTVNIYIDGSFDQNGNKTISVASTIVVNLYQKSGDFTLNGGGLINTSAVPSNFNILSQTSGDIKLNGNAQLYGTVYAPNAAVKADGNFDFYGALLGLTTILSGNLAYHRDISATSPGFASNLQIKSWREYASWDASLNEITAP